MAASYPLVLLQPWAVNGDKNTIPNAASPTPGAASWEEGFPPETMQPIQSGGVPPSGRDMNGGLNAVSQHTVWQNAGGQYKFDAALAAAIGGYSKGMVLQDNGGTTDYISLVDNNSVDFNTTPASIGVQWAVYAGQQANDSIATVTTTGGTAVLTAAQAAADIILVTGLLSSPSTIQFPAAVGTWKLINATTGAQPMVAKAPTGQSLTMTQGFTNTVFYDGTQLVFPDHDSGLDSPAFRGVPTVPTAAPNTNTDQAASTAFCTQGIAAAIVSISALYVNSNFTAGSTGDLWTDTSAGSFTVTLPDPPIGKNLITFRDIFGTWASRPLTIDPGTKTVLGVAGTLIANASGRNFGMWYDTTASTWRLI